MILGELPFSESKLYRKTVLVETKINILSPHLSLILIAHEIRTKNINTDMTIVNFAIIFVCRRENMMNAF
jgi:hypothetical protein